MIEAKRRDAAPQAIWPCRLKTIAAFAKRDPIILGVDILDGTLRVGTPLCVVKVDPTTQKREIVELGKITSLEINHKSMDVRAHTFTHSLSYPPSLIRPPLSSFFPCDASADDVIS
jgi:translation initiation factor IF-2